MTKSHKPKTGKKMLGKRTKITSENIKNVPQAFRAEYSEIVFEIEENMERILEARCEIEDMMASGETDGCMYFVQTIQSSKENLYDLLIAVNKSWRKWNRKQK